MDTLVHGFGTNTISIIVSFNISGSQKVALKIVDCMKLP